MIYQDSKVSILILMDLPFLLVTYKYLLLSYLVSILILMDLPFLCTGDETGSTKKVEFQSLF